jgi:pimeloyl-ACP methyl ester carboxylesterase
MTSTMLRRHYVDCPFGQIHVTTDEEASPSAPPLIMMNSRMRSLLPMLPLLRERHRPIIVDIPGMGLSSSPPAGATMHEVATCLLSLLDAWTLPAVNIFGMHTGHKITAAFASAYPDRVGRLVLAGKTHSIVPPLERRNDAMRGYLAKRPPDVLLVQLEGKFIDDPAAHLGNENMGLPGKVWVDLCDFRAAAAYR